ncbi:hypothetical protein EVAR_18786_1 [Eumeta japonica]|uniref:Uncharacterized protein n=1 Tax=Eumeta variegata TaxID=151549 RepID=A0A4C1ULL3_EUMVA|nr:hypothetical protein EVAR_18786_1 [Eumeta japonica]
MSHLGSASKPYEIVSMNTIGGFRGSWSTKRYCMRWFLDRGCPFHPILETSHSGKSRNGKREELTFLCDVFTLGGHHSFEHECGFVLVLYQNVVFTCELRFTN